MKETTGDWRCAVVRSHGICNTFNDADEATCGACGEDRPVGDALSDRQITTRLLAIEARFAVLRESQSKPGLRTASRGARADLRHATERELARQDVPWLIAQFRSLLAARSPAPSDAIDRLRKVIARKGAKSRALNYEAKMVTVSIEDLETVLGESL